jgi:hypothetical protein
MRARVCMLAGQRERERERKERTVIHVHKRLEVVVVVHVHVRGTNLVFEESKRVLRGQLVPMEAT